MHKMPVCLLLASALGLIVVDGLAEKQVEMMRREVFATIGEHTTLRDLQLYSMNESYAKTILRDNPVGYWSMGHSAVIESGDPQEGECDPAPSTQKATAEGEACGQPGGLEFGDPCDVDAAICTSTTSAAPHVPGLTNETGNDGTQFTGAEYLKIPDHNLINIGADGYPKRSVELWFKASSADAVKRVIFAEGNANHAGLSMFVDKDASDKVHLSMFAWDRGNHDQEFGTVASDRSITPNAISCEIALDQTYYAVMEFNGEARTFTGYIRKPNTDGTQPEVCGQTTNLPVNAKISHHGHGVGNSVIGGIPPCPHQKSACPSSRANGQTSGSIVRQMLADGSAPAENFIGIIDEVALYNSILTVDDMKRHLSAGGDTFTR